MKEHLAIILNWIRNVFNRFCVIVFYIIKCSFCVLKLIFSYSFPKVPYGVIAF